VNEVCTGVGRVCDQGVDAMLTHGALHCMPIAAATAESSAFGLSRRYSPA
jgi:hypothetical protein